MGRRKGDPKKASHDAKKLILACLDNIRHKQISIREAAERIANQTEMKAETIRKRISKLLRPQKAKTHGNQVLTNDQEIALVAVIKALAAPFNKKKVEDKLSKYLGAKDMSPASSPQQETIRLATNIAKQTLNADTPIKKQKVKNAPAKSKMFTAEEMLKFEADRADAAAKVLLLKSKKRKIEHVGEPKPKRQKKVNAAAKPAAPAVICGRCGLPGKLTPTWQLCSTCNDVLFCSYCIREYKALINHQKECQGKLQLGDVAEPVIFSAESTASDDMSE